jgi:hypothetical protein
LWHDVPSIRSSAFVSAITVAALAFVATQAVAADGASPEVVAARRLTQSFNALGGLSFDDGLSASSSSGINSSTASSSQSQDITGRYLGRQLWPGMGGYL